jgi:hypothetical protein
VTYTSPPQYRLIQLVGPATLALRLRAAAGALIMIIVHCALPRLTALRVFPALLTAMRDSPSVNDAIAA